jgi:hypothetical protein
MVQQGQTFELRGRGRNGERLWAFRYRTGLSTFDLSRYMGASLTMIDRHYGHLARDGREHAIKLLDALNAPEFDPWTLVDARWTPKQPVGVTTENESDV